VTRTKKTKPRKEVQKGMQPITRDAFKCLLNRAITAVLVQAGKFFANVQL